jgi:hypothetical protein
MLLINREEILNHREISKNVKESKINPMIEDAQFIDLRPLLGVRFYQYLIANKTDEKVVELLNGGDYEVDSVDYVNPGLNKVLSIFTYARYILNGSFTDTASGMVQKSNQDSTPVSDTSKRDLYAKDREVATMYWYEVKNFLDRNSSDYPLWNKNGTRPRGSGMRISKITI